jgi:hypothetical protein
MQQLQTVMRPPAKILPDKHFVFLFQFQYLLQGTYRPGGSKFYSY